MPRPPKAIDKRFATMRMIIEELPKLPPHLNRRLRAIRALYDKVSTSDAADIVGVSRRTVQRWLAVWNNDRPHALLVRVKRGPKRKISPDQFQRDFYPLLLTADGGVMPNWSLAEVKRKLSKKPEIQVSFSTLRRTFRRFGYRPQPPPRKVPVELPHNWNYPWPAEYGCSLSDYLRRQEAQAD